MSNRFRPIWARLALLLAVVGPGIITANVDNDAGGITTYSVAGAHYGYSLLWMMPLVALALIIIQEMSARLGVVTGKGLADLIRESMGVRATAIILGILMFANLRTRSASSPASPPAWRFLASASTSRCPLPPCSSGF
jgi:Mn2+/Fe2+ NRAMP family transporter